MAACAACHFRQCHSYWHDWWVGLGRTLDVAGVLSRTFLPRRWRSEADALSDESAERGKALLRQEQVCAVDAWLSAAA